VTEPRDMYEPDDEPSDKVEAMVRAAGGYVGASDDLRPRVLETARVQCSERRAQRCIRQAAVFVVLSAVLTMSSGRGLDSASDAPRFASLVNAESIFLRAESGGGDCGWGMVDAFTELRLQQAKALRFAL
jgi:hypothetical protein